MNGFKFGRVRKGVASFAVPTGKPVENNPRVKAARQTNLDRLEVLLRQAISAGFGDDLVSDDLSEEIIKSLPKGAKKIIVCPCSSVPAFVYLKTWAKVRAKTGVAVEHARS